MKTLFQGISKVSFLAVGASSLALLSLAGSARAEDAPPPPADADPFVATLSGNVSIWSLNQRNFFLGKDVPLNNGDYVVQNFQLGLKVGRKAVGGVLRLDAAQGWWGVDNDPNTQLGVGVDENGNPVNVTTYNPDALFSHKDTNYPVHVDHAYLYFQVPQLPIRLEVGRQFFGVGNKIVLDQDLEGVVAKFKPMETVELSAWWAKVSEGQDSYKAPVGSLMNDDGQWADANLFGLTAGLSLSDHKVDLYGLYYRDGIPDWDYYPQGLGYFHSRFQPQVSMAIVGGLSAAGSFKVGEGLGYQLELDYLTGADEVDNADYAGNLLDKNDGTLSGYNAYLTLTQKLTAGIPLELGLVAGMGSGDADPSSGPGNINRIQTMGFFGLANVWEDSVMPDLEGITPQGLGSPASRAYRELENTTVGQLKLGIKPLDTLRIDLSYTYVLATQPVHGWDANGPTAETARDLGQEVDADLTIKIWKELVYKAQVGYFIPGTATALLINGNTEFVEPAMELRQILMYKF